MPAERSEHIRLYGLQVDDPAEYARYRALMGPILVRYGGRFGYDFDVKEVFKSEVASPINRVFTICFPDRAAAERFFADPAYLLVRGAHFEPSVRSVTLMASF
jgi:uncharacterized protein (DUF1330 family)